MTSIVKSLKDRSSCMLQQEFPSFEKRYLENHFWATDMVALLVRFLEQNNGAFSNRAKEKEFKQLSPPEIAAIEENYKLIFAN